jgi:hypothetical protein
MADNASTLIDAAEAVKDALNNPPADTFDQTFTAVRAYRPKFTPKELKTLRVVVVPRAYTRTRIARAVESIDPVVQVGVMQQIDPPTDADTDAAFDNTQADALMVFCEAVGTYLQSARLPGFREAFVDTIENDPAWSPDHLAETNTFISVLTITLRRAKKTW